MHTYYIITILVLQSECTIWSYQIKTKLSVKWRGATCYGYKRSLGVWKGSCSSNWSSDFSGLEGIPLESPVLGHKLQSQPQPARASKMHKPPLLSPSPTVPFQNYKHCSSKSLLYSPGHQLLSAFNHIIKKRGFITLNLVTSRSDPEEISGPYATDMAWQS